MFSPGLYQEGFNGSAASAGIEELYPTARYGDDLFWASTWMYRASTAGFRTFNQTYYQDAMSVTMSLSCAPLSGLWPLTSALQAQMPPPRCRRTPRI